MDRTARLSHAVLTSHRALVLPLLACALGIALFVGMDVIMKYLALRIGAFNAVLWRVAVSLPPMIVWHYARGHRWPDRAVLKVHVLRGASATVALLLYFWALKRVTLAQGIALSFIAPLVALLLAALMLKERVHRASLIASLVALAGVLVILGGQPAGLSTEGDRLAQGAVLIGASFYAVNIVLGRRQAQLAGPFEVALWFNIVAFALFVPALPLLAILPPAALIGPILLAAVIANACVMLIAWAYARAETQYLLPLEYTAFLWAALFGWAAFGEQVTAATFAGAALIVGGCLWGLRQPRPATPAAFVHGA